MLINGLQLYRAFLALFKLFLLFLEAEDTLEGDETDLNAACDGCFVLSYFECIALCGNGDSSDMKFLISTIDF
jgi:hypothetical protein